MANDDRPTKNEAGNEDEEEEEEIDEGGYKQVKDAVLFAIDVSPSMLLPPKDDVKGNTDPPAAAALKCAFAYMQQRIISNPKDKLGILLYGTEESKFPDEENSRGSLSYPHCYLLTDLDIPDARDVRLLEKLVENEDESAKLLVPSKEPVSMANVLFCANQIFTTRAANFSSRRLFIVTDNDDPHASDKSLKDSAIVRAKDLYDLGVIIELFPISTPDQDFDRSKFYDDVTYNNSFPTDPDAPAFIKQEVSKVSSGDGISLLSSLLSEINSKGVTRRAQFSNLPLEIGPGFKISVKGFIMFKRQEPARSTFVWTYGETPTIPKLVNSLMAGDGGRLVEKMEVQKAYNFGGEQILFTPDEIKTIRNFGEPGIRIIGFKPLSMLPLWASVNKATFIYPSEGNYVGSNRVFSALQQKLLKDQKMAVTWFLPRRNAVPVFAALIPGQEKFGDSGEQVMPPGLWLIQLPYADDIRSKPPKMDSFPTASDELIDKMRPIVGQLMLPKAQYNPSKYPNPALQWHYRILQAMALDEDLPEHPEDKTIPKYKQINKRVGETIEEWNAELDGEYRRRGHELYRTSENQTAKRPASASASSLRTTDDGTNKTKKRVKVDPDHDGGFGGTDKEMAALWREGKLDGLKVTDLKTWLAGKKLSVMGRKSELLERVEEWWERRESS